MHHAVWREYVQSVLDGAPKVVQYITVVTDGWMDSTGMHQTGLTYLGWTEQHQYRIRPSTITRTLTYPAPVRVSPKRGDGYWIINVDNESGVEESCWKDDGYDHIRLKRGMIFTSYADAKGAADALFGGEQ
jgi:hypothetical protein